MSISISGSGAITGASTSYSFDQAVSIAGTVTYEDVTSVDSVGIITGRNGMHITSGNVGIGTDGPNAKLQISNGNANDHGDGIILSKQGGNLYAIYPSTNNLEFKSVTGNTHIATFDYDGDIGIGTDNPGAKTHIDSTTSNTPLVVEASQNNRSRIVFRNNVETGTECNIELFDDDLRFVTNSGERVRITSGGNIGIGLTTPGRQLTLSHASQSEIGLLSGADTSGGLIYQNASEQKVLIANRESDGHISFETGGVNERMRIDNTGRVGVGTDTFNDAAEVMRVQAASGQANTIFTIKSNDNSSGQSILNFGDDDFNEGRIIYDHSDNSMRFRTNDTERFRINSTGGTLYYGDTGVHGGVTATTRAEVSADGTLDLEIPGTSLVGHLYVISVLTSNAANRTSRSYRIAIRLNNSALITQEFSETGSGGGRSFSISEVSGGSFPNTLRFTDTSSSACTVSMHFVGAAGL